MLKSKEARDLILRGARELFPQILPSRLQEARSALLEHLNLTEKDFGYFPSGLPKYDNYCSRVVSTLKKNGEMITEGWIWKWNLETDFENQVEEHPEWMPGAVAMMLESHPEPESFNIFEFEEIKDDNPPSLYNLGDEDTMIRLVATTPCFGKVVQSDSVCQGCPLFDLCREKKGEHLAVKKEAKNARNEALQRAKEAGYDLKGLKIPKSAKVHESEVIVCQNSIHCIATNTMIEKDEEAIRIPSWGILKKDVLPLIQEITR